MKSWLTFPFIRHTKYDRKLVELLLILTIGVENVSRANIDDDIMAFIRGNFQNLLFTIFNKIIKRKFCLYFRTKGFLPFGSTTMKSVCVIWIITWKSICTSIQNDSSLRKHTKSNANDMLALTFNSFKRKIHFFYSQIRILKRIFR